MLRAALVSVNNGTLHLDRSILQIANDAQSPTYLSTLEHFAKSFARTCPGRKQAQKYFRHIFPPAGSFYR
jgi:hypothetical protein